MVILYLFENILYLFVRICVFLFAFLSANVVLLWHFASIVSLCRCFTSLCSHFSLFCGHFKCLWGYFASLWLLNVLNWAYTNNRNNVLTHTTCFNHPSHLARTSEFFAHLVQVRLRSSHSTSAWNFLVGFVQWQIQLTLLRLVRLFSSKVLIYITVLCTLTSHNTRF